MTTQTGSLQTYSISMAGTADFSVDADGVVSDVRFTWTEHQVLLYLMNSMLSDASAVIELGTA